MDKPIYNHVTGALDAPEKTDSPDVSDTHLCTNSLARTLGSRHKQRMGPHSTAVLRWQQQCACLATMGSMTADWHPGAVETRHVQSLPDPLSYFFLNCLLSSGASLPQILVIEGLHPFYDERVRNLVDFKIYLDISDEIKFAWKIQRDMAERGHSLDSIKKSIEARKPDFDAYIDPQKKHADMIIQVRS